jgi:putative oxidoreductase
MLAKSEHLLAASGRILLGLYFFLAGGVNKVFNFQTTADYMAEHDMIMIPFLLTLTMLIQLIVGATLIIGFQTKISAFLLAGLTLVISLVLHDFWTLPGGELQTAHETQNFVKNMGIVAGLLVCAGLGGGQWSLDSKRNRGLQQN